MRNTSDKAMTESPKFKVNYNKITVLSIQHTRMQKNPEEGEATGVGPVIILYIFFSLDNMVGTLQKCMYQAPDRVKDV